MHLLATQSGIIGEGATAVDLRQDPADIVVLSAADSELTCLARAYDTIAEPKPSLRLASLLALQHHLSVDLYAERTLSAAKLIVLRLLGGKSYWSYGVEVLQDLARRYGSALAVLPGDQNPDPALLRLGTLDLLDAERLRQYFASGGIDNAVNAVRFAQHLLGKGPEPEPARPVPSCGVYREGKAHHPFGLIIFYRALVQSGFTAPIDALADALQKRGFQPHCLYVQSLKDKEAGELIAGTCASRKPSVIVNTTGFAVGDDRGGNPLSAAGCVVLQAVLAGSSREDWEGNPQGLAPRDLAMNVVLPELDGRIMSRAVSFKADTQFHKPTQCRVVTYAPELDRTDFTAALAANWARLRHTRRDERRIAIILANYPNRDGRIGNGVGYDTPASTLNILRALKKTGYEISKIPASGNDLLEELLSGPTNARRRDGTSARLALPDYRLFFEKLSEPVQTAVRIRWGQPESDPFFSDDAFHLPVRSYGNALVAIQPARGYNIDPKSTYHDPALVPPHGYLAFYMWLREIFLAHAVIHNGKHGNLEWLPGKAVALSSSCFPEAALGTLPNLYPFIVNDPGEGTQAKRRTGAVIIDHLTPPLTRAETYGPLRDLESLVDEYYLASGVDQRRLALLRRQIFDAAKAARIDLDAGIEGDESNASLQKLDAWLCELKEAQIRDGLHVLGEAPSGSLETNLIAALLRTPRRAGEGADQSLLRALARDLNLTGFDPLTCDMARPWEGARPHDLACLLASPWRSCGDTVERLEMLAAKLIEQPGACSPHWPETWTVLQDVERHVRPALLACGDKELANLLEGLDGGFVEPGPSGAPTRGRLDVLPTGRNFYSLDNRAVPTPTAWSLGSKSAETLIERHFQEHGTYPRSLGLSVWGTSNMRTGGDDIAQALAFIGVKPVWDRVNWRLTGFEIMPIAALGRPRVDVTLRISGFFRDALPLQIELFDKAVRAVGALDENPEDNPIASRMRQEAAALSVKGVSSGEAVRLSGQRIFGSKPGTYGAGLQALIDEKLWNERSDLARAYVLWGAYAYGAQDEGSASTKSFEARLKSIEAVVHNQDNREHDLLDSDDYYQFEGGMTAAVEQASGKRPVVYHNDHSRPERPLVRTLEEEIGRVMRSRVVNPKWITGIMRHGYKGAFEIAATVDYLFAFCATTGAVKSHHFDLAYDAFIADEKVLSFLADSNRSALRELAQRFTEAITRGLWTPRSNSAYTELARLTEMEMR